jgi:hypothetical protein
VLKLIYHNAVFGPIDLEFERPMIRVGRSEDNDLVLRHPSVEEHHCVLVFRDEKLVWLSASDASSFAPCDEERVGERGISSASSLAPSDGERAGVRGPGPEQPGLMARPEFGPGDLLQIGELSFNVERSSKLVAIPAVRLLQANAEPSATEAQAATDAQPSTAASRNRYFCPKCRVVYQSSDLKRVGLVGHAKRSLCPKCSHVFDIEPEPAKPVPVQPAPTPKGWFHRSPPSHPPTTQERTGR